MELQHMIQQKHKLEYLNKFLNTTKFIYIIAGLYKAFTCFAVGLSVDLSVCLSLCVMICFNEFLWKVNKSDFDFTGHCPTFYGRVTVLPMQLVQQTIA